MKELFRGRLDYADYEIRQHLTLLQGFLGTSEADWSAIELSHEPKGIPIDRPRTINGYLHYKLSTSSRVESSGDRLVEANLDAASPCLIQHPDGIPMVLMPFTYCDSVYSGVQYNSRQLVIMNTSDIEAGKNFLATFISGAPGANTRLHTVTQDDDYSVSTIGFFDGDHLCGESAAKLRENMALFINNRKAYEEAGIDYRRGYLLYGPPGNGKTSSVKALSNQFRLDVYTLDFSNPEVNDIALRYTYRLASNNTPSIVLFEDLDRVFGKNSSTSTRLSFQGLLNAIDGVDSPQGVITIATANNPNDLDTAILRRPGRFDRLIAFGNPNAAERSSFFRKRLPDMTENVHVQLVDNTDYFSFAQLSEIWKQAVFNSPDGLPNKNVTGEQLLEAADTIMELYSDLKQRRRAGAGFTNQPEGR